MKLSPKKIVLNKHGSTLLGYLTATDGKEIPFPVKRAFWTYFTPQNVVRGGHAHKTTWLLLIALTGKITVTTETLSGRKKTFILDKPNVGLLIPPLIWHIQRHSHTAIQLALASQDYKEKDYIRDYKKFKKNK